MKKCGLCGKEIEDDKYNTVYKRGKLVLIAHTKCFTSEKYAEIVKKVSG